MPDDIELQKSEVHDATDDADSSPANRGEPPSGTRGPAMPHGKVRDADVDLSRVKVVRDETAAGGPLSIETDEPGLAKPEIHADAFADPTKPTDGTPEFEPREERRPPEPRK